MKVEASSNLLSFAWTSRIGQFILVVPHFFSPLFGDIEYAVSYSQDPRSLLSVHVRTSQIFDTTVLLNNLNSMASASYQS